MERATAGRAAQGAPEGERRGGGMGARAAGPLLGAARAWAGSSVLFFLRLHFRWRPTWSRCAGGPRGRSSGLGIATLRPAPPASDVTRPPPSPPPFLRGAARSAKRRCWVTHASPTATRPAAGPSYCAISSVPHAEPPIMTPAREHGADAEILLWMTPSESPRALQTSECNELLDPTRASWLILAQRQPGKFISSLTHRAPGSHRLPPEKQLLNLGALLGCLQPHRPLQPRVRPRRGARVRTGVRHGVGRAPGRWPPRKGTSPPQSPLAPQWSRPAKAAHFQALRPHGRFARYP